MSTAMNFKVKANLIIFMLAAMYAGPAGAAIAPGAENMSGYLPLLKGKKVALVVNQTSVVGKTHLLDTLISLKIRVKKIFAPEHGFRGNAEAGADIKNEKDKKTGIPIISLFGNKTKP